MTGARCAVNVIYRKVPLAAVRLFAGLFSPIRRWKTGVGEGWR
jgi:hypothetical protein